MVELIVAMTLFLMVVTSGIMLMDRSGKASKKIEMKEYLYRETQLLLERIAREVEVSAIDYEEYYSRNIVGSTSFGENYGDYHAEFFASSGYDTGANPYQGSGDGADEANAFCPTGAASPDPSCSTTLALHQTEELFLMNREGNHRTYFVRNTNAATGYGFIATLELDGSDSETDADGFPDTWTCSASFTCSSPIATTDFASITPSTVAIDALHFYISPLEDPFKGFDETSAEVFDAVQVQPSVTIVLTAHYQPYDSAGNSVAVTLGDAPSITVQTTAKTGLYAVIAAYEP